MQRVITKDMLTGSHHKVAIQEALGILWATMGLMKKVSRTNLKCRKLLERQMLLAATRILFHRRPLLLPLSHLI